MQLTHQITSEVFILRENDRNPLRICYCVINREYSGEEGDYRAFAVGAKLYSGDELIDEARADDVVFSESEALTLIGLLSKNSVTPCALRDVIEDYLASQ